MHAWVVSQTSETVSRQTPLMPSVVWMVSMMVRQFPAQVRLVHQVRWLLIPQIVVHVITLFNPVFHSGMVLSVI